MRPLVDVQAPSEEGREGGGASTRLQTVAGKARGPYGADCVPAAIPQAYLRAALGATAGSVKGIHEGAPVLGSNPEGDQSSRQLLRTECAHALLQLGDRVSRGH